MSGETMPKTILVVDDEEAVRRFYRRALERGDRRVIEGSNGREGLESLRTERPDLILLDAMMPVVDGYDVCRYLKGRPSYRDIPVLMISVLGGESDRRWAAVAGADRTLAKPAALAALRRTVEEMMGESAPAG